VIRLWSSALKIFDEPQRIRCPLKPKIIKIIIEVFHVRHFWLDETIGGFLIQTRKVTANIECM
jgi:hypothetical protein